MRNIELKARLNNKHFLTRRIKNLGGRLEGTLHQLDTYYNCEFGRLKLREINEKEFQLIYYIRPDLESHKMSEYDIIEFTEKVAKKMKELLAKAYGVKVVVVKTRELWMYGDTRIHLDDVNGLGQFLELESVVLKSLEESQKEYNNLIEELELNQYEKVTDSYGDLLMKKDT